MTNIDSTWVIVIQAVASFFLIMISVFLIFQMFDFRRLKKRWKKQLRKLEDEDLRRIKEENEKHYEELNF